MDLTKVDALLNRIDRTLRKPIDLDILYHPTQLHVRVADMGCVDLTRFESTDVELEELEERMNDLIEYSFYVFHGDSNCIRCRYPMKGDRPFCRNCNDRQDLDDKVLEIFEDSVKEQIKESERKLQDGTVEIDGIPLRAGLHSYEFASEKVW